MSRAVTSSVTSVCSNWLVHGSGVCPASVCPASSVPVPAFHWVWPYSGTPDERSTFCLRLLFLFLFFLKPFSSCFSENDPPPFRPHSPAHFSWSWEWPLKRGSTSFCISFEVFERVHTSNIPRDKTVSDAHQVFTGKNLVQVRFDLLSAGPHQQVGWHALPRPDERSAMVEGLGWSFVNMSSIP